MRRNWENEVIVYPLFLRDIKQKMYTKINFFLSLIACFRAICCPVRTVLPFYNSIHYHLISRVMLLNDDKVYFIKKSLSLHGIIGCAGTKGVSDIFIVIFGVVASKKANDLDFSKGQFHHFHYIWLP